MRSNTVGIAFIKAVTGSGFTILLWAAIIKVIALSAGTSGIAYFTLFRDLTKSLAYVFSWNCGTVLAKGMTGEYSKDPTAFAAAVFKLLLYSFVPWCLIYIGYALWTLKAPSYGIPEASFFTHVAVICTGAFTAVNYYFNGVLNGMRRVGRMAFAQPIAISVALLCSYFIFQGAPHDWAAISTLLIAQSAWMIANIYFVKSPDSRLDLGRIRASKLGKELLRYFFRTSSLTIVVGLATMLLGFGIKLVIGQRLGIDMLGIFDAAWTLGNGYILVILSTLGSHLLPEISSAKTSAARSQVIIDTLHFVLPTFTVIAVIIFCFPALPLSLFYSESFIAAGDLLKLLVLGDLFKVVAWICIMALLALDANKQFALLTLLWDLSFFALSYVLLESQQIESIGYAYIACSLAQMLAAVFLLKKILRFKSSKILGPALLSAVCFGCAATLVGMLTN